MSHTKEPWKSIPPDHGGPGHLKHRIYGADGGLLVPDVYGLDFGQSESNQHRIESCVNAMAGIDDPKVWREKMEADVKYWKECDSVALARWSERANRAEVEVAALKAELEAANFAVKNWRDATEDISSLANENRIRAEKAEAALAEANGLAEEYRECRDLVQGDFEKAESALAASQEEVKKMEAVIAEKDAALEPFDLAHCVVLEGGNPAKDITLHDLRTASEAYHSTPSSLTKLRDAEKAVIEAAKKWINGPNLTDLIGVLELARVVTSLREIESEGAGKP